MNEREKGREMEKERKSEEDTRKHQAVTVKPVSIAFRLPRSNFRVYRAKARCEALIKK